jgi:hypothetical protein
VFTGDGSAQLQRFLVDLGTRRVDPSLCRRVVAVHHVRWVEVAVPGMAKDADLETLGG